MENVFVLKKFKQSIFSATALTVWWRAAIFVHGVPYNATDVRILQLIWLIINVSVQKISQWIRMESVKLVLQIFVLAVSLETKIIVLFVKKPLFWTKRELANVQKGWCRMKEDAGITCLVVWSTKMEFVSNPTVKQIWTVKNVSVIIRKKKSMTKDYVLAA